VSDKGGTSERCVRSGSCIMGLKSRVLGVVKGVNDNSDNTDNSGNC